MAIISEITDAIKVITSFFKKKKKVGNWIKLNKVEVPSWVERASHRFHKKHPVRNHDLRKDFVGDNFVYRVFYKKVAHGRVEEEYWKRKRFNSK